MTPQLAGAAAVIAARQFNPSITNQLWLVDNGIIERDEFAPGCVFTDLMIHVSTHKFALLLTPEQIQFVPNVPPSEQKSLIVGRLGLLVKTLPHTPYIAIGLNFTWHCRPSQSTVAEKSRELFFCNSSPFFAKFDYPTARFGSYCSKEFLQGRMKLDIKPLIIKSPEEDFEILQFLFNYHVDLKPSQLLPEEITSILESWESVADESKQIIDSIDW